MGWGYGGERPCLPYSHLYWSCLPHSIHHQSEQWRQWSKQKQYVHAIRCFNSFFITIWLLCACPILCFPLHHYLICMQCTYSCICMWASSIYSNNLWFISKSVVSIIWLSSDIDTHIHAYTYVRIYARVRCAQTRTHTHVQCIVTYNCPPVCIVWKQTSLMVEVLSVTSSKSVKGYKQTRQDKHSITNTHPIPTWRSLSDIPFNALISVSVLKLSTGISSPTFSLKGEHIVKSLLV